MSLFVTFEGPEGSGKTTQIHLLDRALRQKGLTVVCTREPGGTAIGEQVRTVLHDLKNEAMLPVAEALLYSAARAQHVGQVIHPALARGEVVISDRYAESTLAYQGYGHGLDLAALEAITAFATDGLRPNLVIYLDLDVRLGLERKRRDQREGRGEWNRMDQQSLDFYRRVREGYLHMAHEQPARWLVLDATQDVDAIQQMVCSRVLNLLGQTPGSSGSPHDTGGETP